MLSRKTLLVTAFTTSTLYLAFAATVPRPEPDKPLTTGQKIAKYIKPRAVDDLLDKIRDKAVDGIMHEGAKRVGGPFRGGDEKITREIVKVVIDPREWKKAPIEAVKVGTKVAIEPTKTASPVDDRPGANPAAQASGLRYQLIQTQDAKQAANAPRPTMKGDDVSSHVYKQPKDLHLFTVTAPAKPAPDRGVGGISASAKSERADGPAVPNRAVEATPHHDPPTLEAGKTTFMEKQSEVRFNPNPETRAAEPAAAPPPAASPSPSTQRGHQGDQGQGGGGGGNKGGAGGWAGGDAKGGAVEAAGHIS